MNEIAANVYREDSNRVFYTSKMGRCSLVPGRERGASGDTCFRIPSHLRKEGRRRSRKILQSRSWLERRLFCYGNGEPSARLITPTIFALVSHLDVVGAETEGIFRREGGKSTTTQIISEVIEFDRTAHSPSKQFNFSRYTPLELASALKYYIRETMNGLFDNIYIPKVLSFIIQGSHKEAVLYSKYLLLSLTDDQQKLFIMLRKIFEKIVENKEVTKITWESIYNIFGLTFMPLEAFSTIERIPSIIDLFRCLIGINLDDLAGAVKTLEDK